MKRLTLDRGSRVYRYYRACLEMWEEFRDVPYYRRMKPGDERGDNLCHLVRTMTLAPATMLGSNLAAVGLAVLCGGVIPCRWFGWWPYVRGILWVVVVVALIISVCFLWSITSEWIKKRRSESFDYDAYLAGREKVGTFKRLAQVYTRSKLHDKICPFIEFEGEEVTR